MSAWSCPHDVDGVCQRVAGAICRPTMRGCVMAGRVRLANDPGAQALKPVRAPQPADDKPVKARRRLPF